VSICGFKLFILPVPSITFQALLQPRIEQGLKRVRSLNRGKKDSGRPSPLVHKTSVPESSVEPTLSKTGGGVPAMMICKQAALSANSSAMAPLITSMLSVESGEDRSPAFSDIVRKQSSMSIYYPDSDITSPSLNGRSSSHPRTPKSAASFAMGDRIEESPEDDDLVVTPRRRVAKATISLPAIADELG
jgi:hypothetical protein